MKFVFYSSEGVLAFAVFARGESAVTNAEIRKIAIEQSAIDANCSPSDFLSDKNGVVISAENKNARKYLSLPFFCNLISYGNNVVASVHPSVREAVENYICKYPMEHCFETPNMHVLNDVLKQHGNELCFMAEYFLPDVLALKEVSCDYEMRILRPDAFRELYQPQWSNALCEKRKHLDMLAVGAFDGETLVGLAGVSADCDTMYQIGIDVLPAYRKKGIAKALVSKIAVETLALGKVPFYCAAWSNLPSVRTALACGFRPGWVELTAKETVFVNEMNQ